IAQGPAMNEESLFREALAKPPGERAAFLDTACADKPGLRAAVEALLAADEASGGFLNRLPRALGETVDSSPIPADPAATAEHTPSPTPSLLHGASTTECRGTLDAGAIIAGRYTLQEKLGEGGMGEVWVARQTEPVKRKVALKLIKPGMDSRAVLQRFEQERQ